MAVDSEVIQSRDHRAGIVGKTAVHDDRNMARADEFSMMLAVLRIDAMRT